MRPSLPAARIALTLLCLVIPLASAHAEPQNGGAAISLKSQGIRAPFCIVAEPDSGALVLLEDTRNANIDLYVQRTDRHGRPTLGAGGTMIWSSPIGASLNSVSPDGAGGILFAWSVNGGVSGQDVMVERVLASGALAYPLPGIVVCNAIGDQTSPYLATGQAGSYWVAWGDQRAGISGQADIYAQRLNLAGVAQLAAGGVPVNTSAYRTYSSGSPYIAPDGSGGLLLSWGLTSSSGVRAQRLNAAGVGLYGMNGAALGDPTDSYAYVVPDATGGLWAWTSRWDGSNYTAYAHHLTSTGVSSFAPTGVVIHGPSSGSLDIHPVHDASNGCFFYGIAYNSTPSNGGTVFRQQIDAAGNVLRGAYGDNYGYPANMMNLFDTGVDVVTLIQDFPGIPGWDNRIQRWGYDGTGFYPGTGVVIGRSAPNYGLTAFAAGGSAGHLVVAAEADPRYNTPGNPYNYQTFGQAFDASGNPLWDDAENPTLVSAKDAPGDQGGLVRAVWNASVADDPSAKAAVGYRGWRSLELSAATQLAARHAGVTGAFEDGGKHYVALSGQYWEQVAQEPATQLPGYALSLPTGRDSTASGNANESYMIEAYDDSLHHWYSSPLIAHSVDNLAPAAPAPFTGTYVAGTTYTLWHANTEADLAGYRLYRGTSAGFTPGPGNLIASLTSPGFDDHYGFPAIYKLSAVDIHGNESPFAVLVPAGTLGVGGDVPHTLAFTLGSRNPAHDGALLQLALPAAGRVRVAIYDLAGREVRTLVNGDEPAGARTLEWDGADGSGRVAPSGLYLARLVTSERTITLRLAMTR